MSHRKPRASEVSGLLDVWRPGRWGSQVSVSELRCAVQHLTLQRPNVPAPGRPRSAHICTASRALWAECPPPWRGFSSLWLGSAAFCSHPPGGSRGCVPPGGPLCVDALPQGTALLGQMVRPLGGGVLLTCAPQHALHTCPRVGSSDVHLERRAVC